MQLLPIVLVAVVMAVAEGFRPIGMDWGLSGMAVASLTVGPVLVLVLWTMLAISRHRRRLSGGRAAKAGARRIIIASERTVRIARLLIVANHVVAVLVFGWVGTVRSIVGDAILLDELIAVLPPLLGLIGLWWTYYPVERLLHGALLIRRLDEGQPVYPAPSRTGYIVLQVRLNLLLMLTPILIILAASELFEDFIDRWADPHSVQWLSTLGTLVIVATVFIFAPLLARLVLDVQPLPPGELRRTLMAVCDRHRVRVRELLLWNTHGSIINAAVMGLVGPLRYVMMTDALLEMLHREQVRAVMAHEIGHVRRHHMPWMVLCLLASFVVPAIVIDLPMGWVASMEWINNQALFDILSASSMAAQFILGLWLFGWICRRFERQADTFAVQHLSGMGEPMPAVGGDSSQAAGQVPPAISVEAVGAMRGALDAIARLNTVDHNRPSWRHGSIAWRIKYLVSIIGRPVTQLPIDRLIRSIKGAVALVLIGAVGYEAFVASRSNGAAGDQIHSQVLENIRANPDEPIEACAGAVHPRSQVSVYFGKRARFKSARSAQ